ncbi:MAG: universal stress protein, partial [Natronospirillum sp.]
MNPILVYLDPAEDSVPVLAKARYLAERLKTALVLFSAVYDPNLAKRSPFHTETGEQAISAYLREREQDLEQHAATLRDSGLPVSVRIAWNKNPWQGMNGLREEQEFELIIKGTHHQNVVQRTFFSSTDWDLMRCSPLPVLLVKRSAWPEEQMRLTACV